MAKKFDPDDLRDSFKDEVMALVHRKLAAGQTESVTALPAADAPTKSADIIDLSELLERSLKGGGGAKSATSAARAKRPAAKKKRAA